VVGALLLFADYTVTASLSALDAFHYFGLGHQTHAKVDEHDYSDHIRLKEDAAAEKEPLLSMRSPGLWAIVSLVIIGALT